MHYYQFNIADYRKDTMHLNPEEHYVYRELLDWMYLDEAPIPLDISIVLRRLRLGNDRSTTVQQVLNDFFTETNEGYIQERVLFEIKEYNKKLKNASKAGKASAKARKQKASQRTFNGRSTTVQPTNNYKPITKVKENNKKKKSNKTFLPKDFEISERVRKWADDKNYSNLDQHFENFVLQAKAKEYEYADWDSAFMNAVRNDWAKVNSTNNSEEVIH